MKKRGALKDRLAGIAHGLGYTVIPNWRLDTFASAAFLRRLLAHLEIDCVIDVGANAGQYHDFLRSEVGFEGLVASYIHGGRIGALIELSSETDFVARNPQFVELAGEIAKQVAAMAPADIDALLKQAYIRDSSKTIGDMVTALAATIGENIQVRRIARFQLGE